MTAEKKASLVIGAIGVSVIAGIILVGLSRGITLKEMTDAFFGRGDIRVVCHSNQQEIIVYKIIDGKHVPFTIKCFNVGDSKKGDREPIIGKGHVRMIYPVPEDNTTVVIKGNRRQ